MIETCNGCEFKKRCNGRCTRNSTYCIDLRKTKKPQKSVSWFYKTFRGLDKQGIFLKYLQHKEHKEKKENNKEEKPENVYINSNGRINKK